MELLYTVLNVPPGDCPQGVQLDFTCSEPTSRGLSAGGASCFLAFESTSRHFWTWIQTVIQFSKSTSKGCLLMSQSFFVSSLSVCYPEVTKVARISLPLSLCLSLAEQIASGDAQTGSQSISKPNLTEQT